jgi:hypothetical protein
MLLISTVGIHCHNKRICQQVSGWGHFFDSWSGDCSQSYYGNIRLILTVGGSKHTAVSNRQPVLTVHPMVGSAFICLHPLLNSMVQSNAWYVLCTYLLNINKIYEILLPYFGICNSLNLGLGLLRVESRTRVVRGFFVMSLYLLGRCGTAACHACKVI